METTADKKPAPATALDGKNESIEIVNPETNNQPLTDQNGGHPSNRPPSKVNPPDFTPSKVLYTGVDTLVVSVFAAVRKQQLFDTFTALKEKAQIDNKPVEGTLLPDNDGKPWQYLMRPHGIRGYTWLLEGKDYFIKIVNTIKPAKRPNIMIEIRSETLCNCGPVHATEYILKLLNGIGFELIQVKPSRIDLFTDIILDNRLWEPALQNFIVSYARSKNTWTSGSDFTGLSIGTGLIKARLYDKIIEIMQHSKKAWMLYVWGDDFSYLSEDTRIIRVEFQLRREAIKSLIDCDIFTTFKRLHRIWAYCTQEWLKFQDNPGEHHTRRKNFPWWNVVQNGFMGIQSPAPFIRKHAFRIDKKQLCSQIYGLLTSLHAATLEERNTKMNKSVNFHDILSTYADEAKTINRDRFPDADIITEDVCKKRARYHRID